MSREQELTVAGAQLLGRFCTNVEREYSLDNGYRIDLKGELPNGQWALVEVKGFDNNLTPFIDAVFQAKSYADAKHMLHCGLIDDRQSAWLRGADRADIYVRLFFVRIIAALAKHLRFGL